MIKPLQILCEQCRAEAGEPCKGPPRTGFHTGFHPIREHRAAHATSPDDALDQRLSGLQQLLRDGYTDHEAMSRTVADARDRIRRDFSSVAKIEHERDFSLEMQSKLETQAELLQTLYDDSLITINVMRDSIETLEMAIRAHRDARGDDRCWQDDETLYQALPEGYTPPAHDTSVELRNCLRYLACRQHPATVYVSPEREIELLRTERDVALGAVKAMQYEIRQLEEALREYDDAVRGAAE